MALALLVFRLDCRRVVSPGREHDNLAFIDPRRGRSQPRYGNWLLCSDILKSESKIVTQRIISLSSQECGLGKQGGPHTNSSLTRGKENNHEGSPPLPLCGALLCAQVERCHRKKRASDTCTNDLECTLESTLQAAFVRSIE